MPVTHECIRDIMTKRVVTISMDETLQVARRVFNDRQFHHLIVLENGKPVGVLSDRDLLKHLSPFVGSKFSERPQDTATLKKRVHQMMTRKLVSISPNASAREAAVCMMRHGVSCLPVTEDDAVVGIITTRDLLRAFVRERTEPAG